MTSAPLHALIVGLGSIGRRHARNWAAQGLGPVSVCRQTGAPVPEPLGIPAREYADLNEALSTRPDVVFVTNPTSLHIQVACRAVQAGSHVFLEKPLSHTLAGVAELLDEARRRYRQVMVGYNLRFHPGLSRMRDLLRERAVGRLVSARAEVGEYLPDWHPWEDYRQSYSGRSDLGGGPLLTFSHELDALCWLLGAPTRLTALAAHASSLEIDTEDVAEVLLQFPDGALGSVHVDYVRRAPRRYLEVIGEEGVLRWEFQEHRLLRYVPSTRQWRVEEGDPKFERNAMYEAEVRQVAACVRGEGAGRLADGVQGAAVLALTLAARRSAEAGGNAITMSSEGEPVVSWLTSLGH